MGGVILKDPRVSDGCIVASHFISFGAPPPLLLPLAIVPCRLDTKASTNKLMLRHRIQR